MDPNSIDHLDEITEEIIGAAFEVSNTLGSGFIEKVYENALATELKMRGLKVEQQVPLNVKYKGENVGDFQADLLVGSKVLVELKATQSLDESHFAQCLNYLKATGYPLCLLLNFGSPRVFIKRIING